MRRREQELEHKRELISQEIHDGACQYMAAARMLFETFRCGQAGLLPGDWRSFDMGMKFLNHADEELRRLASGLGPVQLVAGNLPKAIDLLVEEIEAAGGPDIEVCCDIRPDQIPPRLELAAFRIVQESLANACRHSKSKGILVGLTDDGESLCIQVQDWGVGFNPDRTTPGHFGLNGLRQRVKLLKGTATFHSEPGKGTCVTVELPLVP